MPYDDPDFEDPHELVGVALPGDLEAARAMARALAEEFAQLGFSGDRLRALFRDPHYAGAHQAFLALGAGEIERIVNDAVVQWGGFRVRITDAEEGQARFAGQRLRVKGPGGR